MTLVPFVTCFQELSLFFFFVFAVDYESISLHGDMDSISLHHLAHPSSQSDFDRSSTIPRNSDLALQYRKFAQSKRPASTVSLLADSELMGTSTVRQLQSHTATIRRKPSSKPQYRRGTISGGVPIPISTPQIPLKALAGSGGSDENVFAVPPPRGGGFGHNKLCTSTQSLSALPPSFPSSSSSSSNCPYYQLVPGHMPIPVPVPTVPSLPLEGSSSGSGSVKQQQLKPNHQPLLSRQQQNEQQFQHQQQDQQRKQKLFQQQQHVPPSTVNEDSICLGHSGQYQPQASPPTNAEQNLQNPSQEGEGGGGDGGDMVTLIRGVKLKRTITNDRSAPLLPTPANHK